jgi:hypothetical protein
MLNALLFLFCLCLIAFAGLHIFFALLAGSIAVAGGAWALLVGAICAISVGILAVFLFAGFWIFLFIAMIGASILVAIILFPIFLPILLPLLLVLLVISFFKKKEIKKK